MTSSIMILIVTNILLFNSRMHSDASCSDEQVKACQATASGKKSLVNRGVCSSKEYVHFTHICAVTNYVPGLDFCCCHVPDEMSMCCRYHQHWNLYRCAQDKDAFFRHEKNHVSFYLVTSTEVLLPVILLPAAIFILWFACCCLFRMNSCKRRPGSSASGNCAHVTETNADMRRTKSQDKFKDLCCCGNFDSCGYELAQDMDGDVFAKYPFETNNSRHKTNFGADEDEERSFFQNNNRDDNNLNISCIEVLSRLERKRSDDSLGNIQAIQRFQVKEQQQQQQQQQQQPQQQQKQQQQQQQQRFLDCIPYNFVLLKPCSTNARHLYEGRSGRDRSVAHVRPTVYRHLSCVAVPSETAGETEDRPGSLRAPLKAQQQQPADCDREGTKKGFVPEDGKRTPEDDSSVPSIDLNPSNI